MRRREFTVGGLAATVWGLGPGGTALAAGLDHAEASQGVRLALERGAIAAISELGKLDGFMGNPKVRIPLPGFLEGAAKLLKATGHQQDVDNLVLSMNRAAEKAVPEARTMLVQAAKTITVEDAVKIVRGGDTSVTDYFAGKTRAPLTERFLPIVYRATEREALAARYNLVAGKASKLGLVKGDATTLQRHVTAKALDALYMLIGEKEREIRRDPLGTGSNILRKVFGS